MATSLYIHVPFCSGKCHYCDFFSVPADSGLIDDYLRAVNREARMVRERYFAAERPTVETIYLGGGTPTALTARELGELGRIIETNFGRSADCEFTTEANPESVTGEKLEALKAAGLNRVSIGTQTFEDDLLKAIGRRHTSRQTLDAVTTAQKQGIENIGLDLMYALPGQTMEQLANDLRTAAGLPIGHLSCYELTYEPGTRLYAARPEATDLAEEERQAGMFLRVHEMLTAAQFEHYEISNYARPGFACRHNLRYWRNGDYIGLGPSAAGFLHRRRYKNAANLSTYCRQLLEHDELPVESEETLSDLQFAGETAMLNLRTAAGIAQDEFYRQTGFDPFELFRKQIEKFTNLGLLRIEDGRIVLTLRGFALSNEVLSEVLQ